MSNNKLALFSTPQAKQRSRSNEQVACLKTNCTILSRHYIGCQARQWNLDSIFEHENHACPPSISDMGQLRQRSNSDLMECLTKSAQPATIHLWIGANALDGAAIVRAGACCLPLPGRRTAYLYCNLLRGSLDGRTTRRTTDQRNLYHSAVAHKGGVA